MIGWGMSCCIGRHIGHDNIRLPAQHGLQSIRRIVVHKITDQQGRTGDRVAFQQVDTNNTGRLPTPLQGNLCPAAGRTTQIDDTGIGFQELMLVVNLCQFERRTTAIAQALRLQHIGVVQLSLKPQGRRQFAPPGRFNPNLQSAGIIDVMVGSFATTARTGRFFCHAVPQYPRITYARVKWLGWKDSNLRMLESESSALPLGYTPTGPSDNVRTRGSYRLYRHRSTPTRCKSVTTIPPGSISC